MLNGAVQLTFVRADKSGIQIRRPNNGFANAVPCYQPIQWAPIRFSAPWISARRAIRCNGMPRQLSSYPLASAGLCRPVRVVDL